MNDSIFQEPHEKGSEEWQYRINEDSTGAWLVFGALMLIVAILIYSTLFFANAEVKTESEYPGIEERNGVLYYPDGQPVRNYEQLEIYLSEE